MRPLNSLVVAIVIVCCTLSACSIAEPVTPFPTRARMELGDGEASDYPGDSVPVGYLVGKLDGTATIGGGGWGYDTPPDLFEFTGKSQLTGLPYLLRAKAKMTAEIDIFQGSAPGFAYAEAQYSMRCEKLMECEASKSIYVNCASVQVNADGKAHHSTVCDVGPVSEQVVTRNQVALAISCT